MSGVVVGLVAALIMFVVSCSRTEVVCNELNGKNYKGSIARQTDQRYILDKKGDQFYILQLQGFIFFGTAHRLLSRIKQKMSTSGRNKTRYIILDFERVDILDSTGIHSFIRLNDFFNDSRGRLLITSSSARIKKQLVQGGLSPSSTSVSFFNSLEEGVEWCEEEILKKEGNDNLTPVSFTQ